MIDRSDTTTPLRECSKCGKYKERSEFCKNGSSRDGLLPSCKDCKNTARRKTKIKPVKTVLIDMKDCSRCKQILPKASFGYCEASWDRLSPHCKECEGRRAKTQSKLYSSYKTAAKDRDLSFDLSFDDFLFFWQKQCYYCDNQIDFVGIDRTDSDLGYSLANCVSCCSKCNIMKSDMSVPDFKLHLQKLLKKLDRL